MSPVVRLSTVLLSGLGFGLMVASLAVFASMSPQAGGLGLILAALFFGVVLFFLSRHVTWPQAGPWWIVAAVVWGAGISVGAPLLYDGLDDLLAALDWDVVSSSFLGAYPEEIVKAVGVVAICLSFRALCRPWHAMLVGFVIGLSFEVMENLVYGVSAGIADANSDFTGALETWLVRSTVGGFLLHPVCTMLAGWGIGQALYQADWPLRRRGYSVARWWLAAFGIHFLWNITDIPDGALYLKLAVLMATILGVCYLMLRRAGRLARAERDTGGYLTTPVAITTWPAGVGESVGDADPQQMTGR